MPALVGEIGPQTVAVGERWTVALPVYFRDGDNDDLTYTAASSDPGVATASVDGGELAVTGLVNGDVEVTVTADDGYGGDGVAGVRGDGSEPGTGGGGRHPAADGDGGRRGRGGRRAALEDLDGTIWCTWRRRRTKRRRT